MPPLLLTGTIVPYPEIIILSLRDPRIRLLQYVASLMSWIDQTSIQRIVFCDNSGFDFDYSELQSRAEARGKSLEIISYKLPLGERNKSKGYCEGEIIRKAFEKSRTISESESFFKATGRLFFPDFDAVETRYRGDARAFAFHRFPRMITTFFFKCDTKFFRDELMDCFRSVDDEKGYYIEHAYFDVIWGKPFAPLECGKVLGWSASTGEIYDGYYADSVLADAELVMQRGLRLPKPR